MPNTLTPKQETLPALSKPELEKLEKRVREGLASFVDVGQALMQIKERRGYAVRGFKTFEEYCSREFGFSERHGLRLMLAAETAQKVEKTIGEAPRNEATARVLTKVAADPKLLTKVKERLAKQGASIATATAEKVQEVVDRVMPKTRTMFEEPKPAPAVQVSPTLTDVCPSCHAVPETYAKESDAWHCGACNAVVMVGVISAQGATCPECGKPVNAGAPYCASCGCLL